MIFAALDPAAAEDRIVLRMRGILSSSYLARKARWASGSALPGTSLGFL